MTKQIGEMFVSIDRKKLRRLYLDLMLKVFYDLISIKKIPKSLHTLLSRFSLVAVFALIFVDKNWLNSHCVNFSTTFVILSK